MIKAQTLIRPTPTIMASTVMLGLTLGLALCFLGATPSPARADANDQIRAREAMLRGNIRPLGELITKVESLYEGEIIEVEMEEDETGFRVDANGAPSLLYEIKLLTPQGNLVKLEFDALSLELLTVDGHDSESARKIADD